ncbi:hypothetical protein Fmac_020901 [Flemingia macrophylla]|uniref:Uncharacterized protein n=1 Tax=Flemingia macrophylla TaxID=520843 RepID=A0ABD1LVF0_9FABA
MKKHSRVRGSFGSQTGPAQPPPTGLIDQHQARLDNLRSFAWHPVRCLEFSILAMFDWEQGVREYLDKIGWTFLLRGFHPNIYRTATLEFLASVSLVDVPPPMAGLPASRGVSYWMNGAYRINTLDEFNIWCRLIQSEDVRTIAYQSAICERPFRLTIQQMWRELTGQ